jgi:hydroxymethylglutaryl-CoA synthase
MTYSVGIDKISFYTTSYYIDIDELAKGRGMDVDKCKVGLGQRKMSIVTPQEDIVTMGCEAATDILKPEDIDTIDLVLFASESGFDFSKSAGVYLHKLLKLKSNCRVLEVKQACYAATGALQLACDYIRSNPTKKCLVISSDIAWYGFETAGEVTQGCGAIAMTVSANPRICSVNSGDVMVADVKDFYRPSYSPIPVVDGKLSIKSYLNILKKTLKNTSYPYFCFHMPFATMGDKANKALGENQVSPENLEIAKQYGQYVGNVYNGSLYLSLLSVLINSKENLSNLDIGMFSYGSGAIGEFFSVTVSEDYREALNDHAIHTTLDNRIGISFDDYLKMLTIFSEREAAVNYSPIPDFQSKNNRFTLEKIENGHRYYANAHDC